MGKPVKFADQQTAWYKKNQLGRVYRTRPERKRLLILCEGEKTEPNYFKSIVQALPRHMAKVIDVDGSGTNTQSLVDEAKKRMGVLQGTPWAYDEVWVVFDRDSFPAHQFDNAIRSAEATGFKVAWSNEAFELWYILHFEDRQSAMSRKKYGACLTRHLDERYEKNDPDMYEKLKASGNESLAIRRAKKLKAVHAGIPPHEANPCTHVNSLVERLNKFRVGEKTK